MERPPEGAAAGKLLAAAGIRLRLVIVSAAVLVAGSALAPPNDASPSRAEERANPLIEEQLASSAPAAPPFRGVQDAARLVRPHVVEILPAPRPAPLDVLSDTGVNPSRPPAAAGVVVSDGHVLTHDSALDGRLAVRIATADGRVDDAAVVAHDPGSGLVLLRGTPGLAPPAVIASTPPEPGALVVAAGHAGGQPVALPAFIAAGGSLGVTVAGGGSANAPGLPVFTMEGALVGVLGLPGSGDVSLATAVVDRLIARAAAGDVDRSLGLTVQRLEGTLAQAFGTRGVLISAVVAGGPAAGAGLVAGDVLVGAGGRDITSFEDARDALPAAAVQPTSTLRVIRGRREVTVDVSGTSGYLLAHAARREAATDPPPTAAAVLPAPLVSGLGLSSHARVLSINGVAVTSPAQATRALALRRTLDVLRVRDDRGIYFVAIERPR